MSPFSVVVHLDVLKDLAPCFISGFKPAPVNLLDFQRVQKTLADSVVLAVALAAHAWYYLARLKYLLIIIAGVLAAPIRVMNESLWRITP